MAPSTASSTSASSNTINGAWPPNSIDTFLTVVAHCANNILPTSVEPVKDIFLTMGLVVNSPPISFAEPVITLITPLGIPASSARAAKAKADKGV